MESIKKLLESFKGETYNLCYKLLKEANNKYEVFEYTCKNYVSKPKNGTVQVEEYFSKEEIEEYESLYGDTVDGFLNGTIKKCNFGVIAAEDFYKSLWDSINLVFTDSKGLAFAFYYILIDRKIPYIYLGKPLSMSNDRYQELKDENSDYLIKINYIVRSDYKQRTEKASLILNCLDEIKDYDSKVVVLAQAIALMQLERKLPSDIEGFFKHIESKLAESESTSEEWI